MKHLIFLFLIAYSYEIGIGRQEKQCFGEDITADTLFVGEVRASDMHSQIGLAITVTDRESNMLHYKFGAKEDKFSFVSSIDGPHLLCIENIASEFAMVSFTILTGVAAKDFSNVPSSKDLKESERRLIKITESVMEIRKELQYIKERDAQLSHTNETIQSRIIIYSIITVIILATMAGMQVLYLKKYFKSKKMI